ncbi:MAG: hypothetical protein P8Y99_07265 [Calditrichaceae bacterium]
MEYCPYCSTTVSPTQKVCPNCKKSLDIEKLQSMYEASETTDIDKKVKKQIWFKEHSHIIYPFVTLIIGLIAGIIGAYSFAQVQFINERSDYKDQISQLQQKINTSKAAANDAQGELKQQLDRKDEHIKILKEQRELISKIINFTRRLCNNSVITPNTVQEGEYYTRNIRYLIRQFENQNQLLVEDNFEADPGYNLQTVPQLLNE